MKKHLFILFALLTLAGVSHASYDFSAVCSTGQTLYYRISGSNAIVIDPSNNINISYSGFTKPSGNLEIPSSVNYNGTTYLVDSIGGGAFSYCSGLTSVTIPNSVTSIGNDAFYGCSGLTSVTIGNSVTSIGGAAFRNCRGLTSVTIPNSVTSIGNDAFYGCSGLTSVTIPNSVTSIGGSTFYGCSGLTSVTIPNSVTSIGGSTFYGCSGLTSVTIPNSVDSIYNAAFSACTSLRVLDLGSSLRYVGANAFYNCNRLDTIYSRNPTPATVADVNAFENVWKGLPLIVHAGSRSAYASAYAWREFTNILEGTLPQRIEDAVYDGVSMKSVEGYIVIAGADGHGVTLSDIQGRTLYRGTATGTFTVDVPATGIYLLQLDNHPAKRIAVVR